jgi:HD superfamily phosphohydrolase
MPDDPDEALLIQLIDTPAFQRLRRIRQLRSRQPDLSWGRKFALYPLAGVMAITRRAFEPAPAPLPRISRPHRATVLCAALLHDIGHGPFSHTAEEIFSIHHEHWTRRLIRDVPEIRDRSRSGIAGFGHRHRPGLHPSTSEMPLVWQLVSSQLDCDRLDYLLRDSYFTGASYGQLDLDRILMALRFEPDSGQLVLDHKGLSAIEHYLVVRHFMYAQVYNHPKNLAVTWLLEQAFGRARQLLRENRLEADTTVMAWLRVPEVSLDVDTYLAGDDITFTYHLQRWRHSQDALLADFCRRFLDRDLLKTLEITRLAPTAQTQLLAEVRHYLQTQGYSSEHYAGLRHTWSRGYTTYQQGIELYTDNEFVDIKYLSPLVQTLSHAHERIWLLYPRAIHDWLQPLWRHYSGAAD